MNEETLAEEHGRIGRPPGKESSYNLVKRDLKETLGLAKRVRALILKQIEEFETALADQRLNVATRIELTEKLGNLMRILSQSSKDMARFIVKDEPEGEKESDVMKELMK